MVSWRLPEVKIGVAPIAADAKVALWRALSRFVQVTTVPGATVSVAGWYAVASVVTVALGVPGGAGGGATAGGANGLAKRCAVRKVESVSVFRKATSAARCVAVRFRRLGEPSAFR